MTSTIASAKPTPAYEQIEEKLKELEDMATACSNTLNKCINAFVPSGLHNRQQNELNTHTHPNPSQRIDESIVSKVNSQMESINHKLVQIRNSSTLLEDQIPRRISQDTGPSLNNTASSAPIQNGDINNANF